MERNKVYNISFDEFCENLTGMDYDELCDYVQQPDVKGIAHHNGEGECTEKSGSSSLGTNEQYPPADFLQAKVYNLGVTLEEIKDKETKKFIRDNLEVVHNEDGTCEVKYVYPKGSFMWAVEQMKQGKKVRRTHWQDWNGFHMEEVKGIGVLCSGGGKERPADKFTIEDYEANDWDIYKEPRTLKEIFEGCGVELCGPGYCSKFNYCKDCQKELEEVIKQKDL